MCLQDAAWLRLYTGASGRGDHVQKNYQPLDGPEGGGWLCTLSVPRYSSATYSGVGKNKKEALEAAASHCVLHFGKRCFGCQRGEGQEEVQKMLTCLIVCLGDLDVCRNGGADSLHEAAWKVADMPKLGQAAEAALWVLHIREGLLVQIPPNVSLCIA